MSTDTPKTLEQEIQETTKRINERTKEFDKKISDLDSKITLYTNWAWGFVWTGIAVCVVGTVFYLLRTPTNFNLNLLGDFLGGSVASVWSLAGLFFIYVAFLGQKQQLLNQQLEIMYSQLEVKYTRLELEGQKKEMVKQNQTLKQQQFDNTFFQLLRGHNDIVNSMDLRSANAGREVISSGRDCFTYFFKRLSNKIAEANYKSTGVSPLNPKTASLADTISGYEIFFENNQSDLGHYFRNLYHIFKFVDSSEIEDKKTYTNFVRAQLSSNELILIFYNCLTNYGNKKFKPLIQEYSLLKNMDTDLIFNQAHLLEYSDKAYGK